jgi:hypothetical protein
MRPRGLAGLMNRGPSCRGPRGGGGAVRRASYFSKDRTSRLPKGLVPIWDSTFSSLTSVSIVVCSLLCICYYIYIIPNNKESKNLRKEGKPHILEGRPFSARPVPGFLRCPGRGGGGARPRTDGRRMQSWCRRPSGLLAYHQPRSTDPYCA